MNIKRSVKVMLAKNDKTQKWLAEKLEVSPSALSAMLKTNSPGSLSIESMASIFDMKVSDFIAAGE